MDIETINQTFTDLFRWASMVGNVLTVHTAILTILVLWNGFFAIWMTKKR